MKLLNSVVEVWYEDHYFDFLAQPEEVENKDTPLIINCPLGRVMYEDDDWIRVVHTRDDVGSDVEKWEMTSVRKSAIIKIAIYPEDSRIVLNWPKDKAMLDNEGV